MQKTKSLSLIELLISLSIFSLLILSFANIDMFGRFQLMTADRRVKLQNTASYALDHMTKNIGSAIGDVMSWPINLTAAMVIVRIDSNQNSILDGSDGRIAYTFSNNSIIYYPDWPGSPSNETIARQVAAFTVAPDPVDASLNYIDVTISARWDPTRAADNENPEVNMTARIKMPSVSTN